MPRIAPWMYATSALRGSLGSLRKVIGTSTFFIVTMEDEFYTPVHLFNRQDGHSLSTQRMGDLAGLEILHSSKPLVMPNTKKHPKGQALVKNQIGAYMSHPIRLSDGTVYGTLCTADANPYEFSKQELHALELASNMVAYVIDLENMAVHDPLTGALNRYFLKRYDQGLPQGFGDSFALVYIDLDEFKDINDRYGHDCGDSVLRVIVQRLKRRIRIEDVVVRVGGDEFIVILSGVMSDDPVLSSAVARLHRSIDVEYSIGAHTFRISASIGVSMYPKHGTDFETLIRSADQAMYQVKQTGGKGYSISTDVILG